VEAARDQTLSTIRQPINQDALTRHLEDKSLPYPLQLTEGQATQSPKLISDEMNGRATPEGQPIAERLNQQNTALVKNLDAIRDEAAPSAGLNATPEHAQTLMDAYESRDAVANADIRAKYQQLVDANGGNFPVDGQALVGNVNAALKKQLKSGFLPSGLRSQLEEFSDGSRPMNFEDFETMRSDAASEMRKGGSEAAAAGIVRQQLEALPLEKGWYTTTGETTGDVGALKAMADDARAAAKARFNAIDADPAYKAVVNGTAKSNTFASKFVLGAAREHLQAMQNTIGDQPQVSQALGGITLNQLRDKAGISSSGNGNFTQSGFNKTLDSLRPNLDLLTSQPVADKLGTLGNVSRYAQFQPKGSWVNNSNTAVTAHGLLAKTAAKAAEHGTNMLFHGVPVGTLARGGLDIFQGGRAAAARQAATARSLSPGAGVGLPQNLWDAISQSNAGQGK
jgi:hypothetical protein